VTARPRLHLLIAAAACALAAAVTGVLALEVAGTERADLRLSLAITRLDTSRSSTVLGAISHLADPVPYAAAGIALTAIAWLRRRRRLALAIPPLFVTTGLTTELLKQATSTARWFDAPLWPSGHATAAATMALCAVLVSPRRLQPVVAIAGGVFAVAVGGAMVARSSHMASDVIAGTFIATGYVLAALAILATAARPAARARRDPAPTPAGGGRAAA
jgi:membrane-associated phospholipid phosphatase